MIKNLEKDLKKELKRYSIAEKTIFFLDVTISLMIIFLSRKLIDTGFGKASLTMALILLGTIASMKILKLWGPR
jgi:hypothetical protein